MADNWTRSGRTVTARPTIEQLGYVAEWVETYDFGDNDERGGSDSPRREAYEAYVAWVEHLEREAYVREVAKAAAKQVGRKVDAQVIAAARKALEEQA